eukprot:4150574-Amphidinium_carterae.2
MFIFDSSCLVTNKKVISFLSSLPDSVPKRERGRERKITVSHSSVTAALSLLAEPVTFTCTKRHLGSASGLESLILQASLEAESHTQWSLT